MNKKRFVVDNDIRASEDVTHTYELQTLVDTENKTFYFVVDSYTNVELLCKRINSLVEENEQLKLENCEMEDYLARLEEENKNLKQENYELEKFRYAIFKKMNELSQNE